MSPNHTGKSLPDDVAEAQEIDRVRDLLFGRFSRDVDRRLRTHEQQLSAIDTALDAFSARMAEERAADLAAAELRTAALRTELAQTRRAGQEQLSALRVELLAQLEQLNHHKLDQQQMGAWLAGLAAQLHQPYQPAIPAAPRGDHDTAAT